MDLLSHIYLNNYVSFDDISTLTDSPRSVEWKLKTSHKNKYVLFDNILEITQRNKKWKTNFFVPGGSKKNFRRLLACQC